MSPLDALNRAIEACGSGVGGFAKGIGVSQTAVSNWRTRMQEGKQDAVPSNHCSEIERVTAGAVRRWDLRPDDWHRIWPEIIDHPDAPPVPAEAGTA